MAAKRPRVTGAKEIGRNVQALKGLTRENVFKGLVAGGLLVKKDSQKETPRRTGNLISGAYLATPKSLPDAGGGFTGADGGKLKTRHATIMKESQGAAAMKSRGASATVAVGYTPFYALLVHENPRAGTPGYSPAKDRKGLRAERVHSRVGGWKFLENALKGSATRVLQAITAATRLPPGPVTS